MTYDQYPAQQHELASPAFTPDQVITMSPNELAQNGLQAHEVAADSPMSLDLAQASSLQSDEDKLVGVIEAGGIPFTVHAFVDDNGKRNAIVAPYSAEDDQKTKEGVAFTVKMARISDGAAPTVVGRDSSGLVSREQDTVSRKHFSVGLNGDTLTVSDLNSTNGTRVITAQEKAAGSGKPR